MFGLVSLAMRRQLAGQAIKFARSLFATQCQCFVFKLAVRWPMINAVLSMTAKVMEYLTVLNSQGKSGRHERISKQQNIQHR
jgi:hypothetical protein